MSQVEGPPDGPAPHVFVADLDAPRLAEDDRHHLERVLRVRPGDAITVSDGDGRWRPCRYGEAPEPTGPVRIVDQPAPAIGVAFALVKGARPELVVQKLTELGVDRITPFSAARSVVQWDGEKAARNVARFRRVAREAAMQSRRCALPVIDDVLSWAEVVRFPGAARCDRAGSAPSLAHPTLLIGPEGGWSAEECAAPLPTVALARDVLRAETAAIAAGAVLGGLRFGLASEATR